uniref:Uncharacterized protein n=1 Tax=Vitis vinifera TaxID=29760 RepID=A5ADB6_VITVI|nr:hypothetical protein VITISV_029084 [Vitis vinifera]
MTRIRGGHTDSSLSCNPRPRASSPQDSTTQALEASTIPSSEGGVPSNPSQRRYETRIPLTTPELRRLGLQALESRLDLHSLILGPLSILNVLLTCHWKPSSVRLQVVHQNGLWSPPPIEGNSYCRARPFHSELYFSLEVMRQQQELRDSFRLLQRYHLEHLMTPKEFFYPRVALDFYQSMTTHDAWSPTAIHFSIDGR